MKYVKDKKGYYRKQNLKEFFLDLKRHQKWLLATVFLIVLILTVDAMFTSVFDIFWFFSFILSPKNALAEIPELDLFLILQVLPMLMFPIDLIFLYKRKFSYIVCLINVVVIFVNPNFDFCLGLIYFAIITHGTI